MKSKRSITLSFSKTLAFTLAEIIIVIGIIGIVAEIVIPGVIANTFDAYSLAIVKEDFSIIQQAIRMAEINEGRATDWYSGTNNIASANVAANQVLSKYLKVAKNCGATQGCFATGNYRRLSSTSTAGAALTMYFDLDNSPAYWSNMVLANGSSVGVATGNFGGSSPYYITGLYIVVDVNGLKGPNRWGYDAFMFYLTSSPDPNVKQSLIAFGDNPNNGLNGCYSNAAVSHTSGVGMGCAYWAVYNSNVKYKNGETLP